MAIDLSEITYIERFVVGNNDPEHPKSEAEIQEQLNALNHALTTVPKGKILSMERNFAILAINEHQVILEWVVYHVGYKRRPYAAPQQSAPALETKPPFFAS